MRIFDESGFAVENYRGSQRAHLCCDKHTPPEELPADILRLMPVPQALPDGLAIDSDSESSNDNEETYQPVTQSSRSRGRALSGAEREAAAAKLRVFRDQTWAGLGFKRIFSPVPPSMLLPDRSVEALLAALEYPITEDQVKRVLARHKVYSHSAIKRNTARIAAIITMCVQPQRKRGRPSNADIAAREASKQIT